MYTVNERTFKGRKPAIEDQLQIAELSVGKHNSRKLLSLGRQLRLSREVSRQEILQLAAVRRVRHFFLSIRDLTSVVDA